MIYNLKQFDAVEVHPVRDEDGICEVCEPCDASFWSVYLHYNAALPENKGFGGVECIIDLPNEEQANAFAIGLEEALRAVIGDALIPMRNTTAIHAPELVNDLKRIATLSYSEQASDVIDAVRVALRTHVKEN